MSQGARSAAEAPKQVLDFGRALAATDLAVGFAAPISDLGLIALNGEESASFLHNQLTNDVEHLGVGEARLAGYCSPKGRLMASFLMWRNAETIFLQLPAAIQSPLQKRLQMFVMRAKTKLSDATTLEANQVVLGLGGGLAQALLAQWFDALPAAPFGKLDSAMGTLIRVADAFGAPRYQWLMSEATALAVWPVLAERLTVGGNDAWHLSEIHTGVPQITAATQEQFVPQMVNFELLGGVNFKKGCYPGQEIVARTRYLGKVKRRMYRASITSDAVQAGQDVFSPEMNGQPSGKVLQVSPKGPGQWEALVVVQMSSLEHGLHLKNPEGPDLHMLPLPYPVE